MKRLNIDPEIIEGVREGLAETGYTPAAKTMSYLSKEEATEISAITHAHSITGKIDQVEKTATTLGQIASVNAREALELLGGEVGAREVMGDEATDHLMGMILKQTASPEKP